MRNEMNCYMWYSPLVYRSSYTKSARVGVNSVAIDVGSDALTD